MTHELDSDSTGRGDVEVALLTRWHDDVPGPTEADLAALRATVLAGDRPAVSTTRARRRIVTPVRLAAAAAVTAVAMLAPAAAGQLWPTNEAQASAAELLNQAADGLISSEDAALRPGQWRHVTTKLDYATESTREGDPFPGDRVDEFWVPYDITDDWFRSLGQGGYTRERGGRTDVESGSTVRKPGWGHPTPEFIASIPRTAPELRAEMYRKTQVLPVGQSYPRGHFTAWGNIHDTLIEGYLYPADVRAAIYRVLATVPGVTITTLDAKVDGREGVAFGWSDPRRGGTQQIVIDPATGEYLGALDLDLEGDVSYQSTVQVEVVDDVPAEIVSTAIRM